MADFGVDRAAMRARLYAPNGPVARDLYRRGIRVQTRARQILREAGRIDTGRLVNSITVQMITRAGAPVAQIGTNVEYARFIHDGTGIYGPRGAPIRPKRGDFLVFTPKGSTQVVFARQVRGIRPTPYLKNALPAAFGPG
jgi:phage gpG-like protein